MSKIGRTLTDISGPKRIFITGASGGLGSALARLHAAPGVFLCLWGRDRARLDTAAEQCRALGSTVEVRSLDLADGEAALQALRAGDADSQFDMAYLVAGRGDTRAPGQRIESAELALRLGQVNFSVPAAMASELVQRMAERGGGRVVLIGSAAGQHALPFAAAYAASKAGLARYAQALRIAAAPLGVSVTLAAPGFIDTAAGRAVPGPKPLLLSAEEAARRIARAAIAGKGHHVTPWPFAALRVIDRMLPAGLRALLLRGLAPPGS